MEKSTAYGKSRARRIIERPEFGVFIAFVVLFLFFSFAIPSFASARNLVNILRQIAFYGIMAMGMCMVMTCGDIDLSVGGIYYMAAGFAAYFMTEIGMPIWQGVLIAVLMGTVIGLLNGVLVSYVGLPAFIATLGTQYLSRGFTLVLTDGKTISLNSSSVSDPALDIFSTLGNGKIGDIVPTMSIIFVIVIIITFVLYHKTLLGYRYKAIGCNMDAAVASGIRAKQVRSSAFVIAGFLAACAGILMSAFLNNVQANVGDGMEMEAIAPCIIGGVSVTGGKGSIIGVVMGCLLLGILNNGLVLMGVSTYVQVVLKGVVIIGAVVLDLSIRKDK